MIELANEYRKALKGFKFIDLFCGIGGFHLALESFGAECVYASDIDKDACSVYQRNFDLMPNGDITKIPVEKIPTHDIICAGFPCQPFSISGTQKGFNDDRGKLFYNIINIAKYHQPQIILLENVRNLKVHDSGKTFNEMRSELQNIGYEVFDGILCASDFFVPQARSRLYIVAFRTDLNISEFTFPKKNDKYRVVKDILIPDTENTVNGHYVVDRDYEVSYDDMQKANRLIRIGQIALGRQGERIYSIMGAATTLSSRGGGIGGKTGMYLVDKKVRKLFPRECARLMGFPDDFLLADTQEQCYKLFGNSIVVDVLQHIILEIINQVEVISWLHTK